MPTYEYRCLDCGERLEVFQKFTDKPLTVHPDCGGKLQKVFHASGVVFKGSGYYVTDSRSSSSSSKSSNDSTNDKSESKSKSKGDSKSSDSKSSDSKSGDSKSSDSKSGGSKAGGSKSEPAAASD